MAVKLTYTGYKENIRYILGMSDTEKACIALQKEKKNPSTLSLLTTAKKRATKNCRFGLPFYSKYIVLINS
jgi:hypothetical protein